MLRVEIGDRAGHRLFAVDSDALGQPLPAITAPQQLRIAIKGVWLLDGEYPVSLRLADRVTGAVIDWREAVATFEVVNEGRAEGTVALDVTIVARARIVVAAVDRTRPGTSYIRQRCPHESPLSARPPRRVTSGPT